MIVVSFKSHFLQNSVSPLEHLKLLNFYQRSAPGRLERWKNIYNQAREAAEQKLFSSHVNTKTKDAFTNNTDSRPSYAAPKNLAHNNILNAIGVVA